MFWMNKAVGFVINPFMIGMLLFAAAFVLKLLQRRKLTIARGVKWSLVLSVFAFIWLWFWGCNVTIRLLGVPLEKRYPPLSAKQLPAADAVIVLGGGMGAANGKCIYPEMRIGADRAWHGARLYHAGRAPYVVTTGTGSGDADRVLLLDLGVPEKAIIREDKARNTEEHVSLVKEALQKKYPQKKGKFKVLIVTSAWHMRRALLNFEQSDFEVIPAAADHECMLAASRPLKLSHFFPDAESFLLNSYIFKEYLGYWLYRVKYWVIATTQWSQWRG
jgi:uncharacterized SAM-binding protein YcdF (DUF218 family)